MSTSITELRMLLFEHNIYDAWQFVENTYKTIEMAKYSAKVIDGLITQIGTDHDKWKEDLFETLSREKHVSVYADSFPNNEVTLVGVTADAHFLLNKHLKDFFQYCRNSFDSMSQISNAALLANRKKTPDSTDFPHMAKKFLQSTYSESFPDMANWYKNVKISDEYAYIDSFNNRTKHTLDIYLKMVLDVFSDRKKSEINPFFRKEVQSTKQDMQSYIKIIIDYVVNTYDLFLGILEKECIKDIYTYDRYRTLNVYQHCFKRDVKSELSVVYLTDSRSFDELPKEIHVLLQKKYEDGSIDACNCSIDRILISKEKHSYTCRYVAETPIGDDTLLIYRKYIKDTQVVGNDVQVDEWTKPLVFYRANPYMNIVTASDDDEFLVRTQMSRDALK